ncbi:MAG: mechanosensitive ion channel family protein [Blastocatellia bacterium]|nr:mechanosensitive ion channel family protein [Blastocatellia bacterium]MCS7156188.1 mechanosensitive ion channel family protein [Blastocatellia bacterium]MCX7751462.1 mechanosensitive ion channel family protein [Blastocatellia bacterium]MDW8169175.1 mechanosensitive ion channel family protein [Acidobacteriota bacterium]MDW8256036.1 mechanosensitive ion channel family protein [Acidobacteriota bacterium]
MWHPLLMSLGFQTPPGTPLEVLTRISLTSFLHALLVIIAAYVLIRTSTSALNALARKAPRARFFFLLLAPLIRFALWLGSGVILLMIFAPSRDTLFAVLASVGIALGLGAQDLIKNVFGGLVILVDRPYQVGDRVRIGDAYGEIDHIGLRSTKLTTPDDTRVTIPNSEILNNMVWNANSGVPSCQVVTDLYLPIDTDPIQAMEIGYEAAYSSPYTLLTKPVVVRLRDAFANGPYLILRVKAYVYDHRHEPALQTDITQRAKAEFLRRGLLTSWSREAQGLPITAFNAGTHAPHPPATG